MPTWMGRSSPSSSWSSPPPRWWWGWPSSWRCSVPAGPRPSMTRTCSSIEGTGVTSSLAAAHAALATPLPAASLPAVGVQRAAWLLLAFPMAGAAILLLGGKRTNRWGHWIGVLMPVAAFVYAVIAFVAMLGYPANQRSRDLTLFTWIHVARFNVPVGLQLDQLSICFVLLTTGVGSLIHTFAA